MLKYFVVIVIISAISGCNINNKNKTCEDKQIVLSRYDNGSVMAINVVNCIDTSLTTTISFHPNGDTGMIRPMRNGKQDGIGKQFNSKKELEYIVFCKNGIIDSVWIWNDRNGRKLKTVEFYTNYPSQIVDLVYGMNGVLERYCYMVDQKVMMQALYSSDGAIKHVDGDYLTAIIGNKEKYNVGDSMTFYFFVATPPNDSVRFSAALHYHNDSDSLHLDEFPIVRSVVTISSVLKKSGGYIIPFDILIQHKLGVLKPIHRHAVFRFDVK